MSRTGADVVVVGAGVLGCSIAHALAGRGRDVLVVDRASGPGQGSTAASSAIVRFNYSTPQGVALAWESAQAWRDLAAHLGHRDPAGTARFHAVGSVMLDVPAVPRAPTLALFDAAGVRYEEWDAAELARRVPGLDPGRYWPPRRPDDEAFFADAGASLGGVFTPDAGYVDDPSLAAVDFAHAAGRRGARFRFRGTVVGLTRAAGTWRVDLADGDRLEAPVVVNAAGPWSGALSRLAGADADAAVTQRPLRREVHHAAGAGSDSTGRTLPVLLDLDLGSYLRPDPAGGLYVGSTEADCDPLEWLAEPDDCDPRAGLSGFETQMLRAARRLPGLGVPNRPSGIAGVYDVTDDWTPVYDRSAVQGFYLAVGTSGNQFKNAPAVGPMMADLVEAVEAGQDHDADPVRHTCARTGLVVDLGVFSRRRPLNEASSGTVLG